MKTSSCQIKPDNHRKINGSGPLVQEPEEMEQSKEHDAEPNIEEEVRDENAQGTEEAIGNDENVDERKEIGKMQDAKRKVTHDVNGNGIRKHATCDEDEVREGGDDSEEEDNEGVPKQEDAGDSNLPGPQNAAPPNDDNNDEDPDSIFLGLRVYTKKEAPASVGGQLRHEMAISLDGIRWEVTKPRQHRSRA